MLRLALTLLLAFAAAAGLTACGKKGALELPGKESGGAAP